jgi:predicted phage-related endonuclease
VVCFAEELDLSRQHFIGGSDQADLLRIEPYGCLLRLWHNKRDPLDAGISDNPHVRRGNRLEAVAVEAYEEATGRKTRKAQRIFKGYRAAAIDRHIVTCDARGPGVLEVKCPSNIMCRKYRRDGLPESYVAQMNWYLDLTGWNWGSFAIYDATEDSVQSFDVNVDIFLAKLQREEADKAWALVENGPAPEKLDPKSKACSRCQYFERCHPQEIPAPDTGELVSITSSELARAIEDRAVASEVLREAEQLKQEAEERIKKAIGDATAVDAFGARIYNRTYTLAGIDSKKLKKEWPQIAEAVATETRFKALRIYERKA